MQPLRGALRSQRMSMLLSVAPTGLVVPFHPLLPRAALPLVACPGLA
jgi:hypothetical protein